MDPELRALLDQAIANIDQEVDRFDAGDAAGFVAGMAAVLASIHLAAAQAGATGAGAVLPAGQQAIGVAQRIAERELAQQLGYLQAWAEQLQRAGTSATVSEAAVRARARLYAGAIKATFSAARYAGLPLPYHPGQGSECMGNCLCAWRVERLEGEGNYNAYWVMAAAEHCATCPARQDRNPYRIRKGVLL